MSKLIFREVEKVERMMVPWVNTMMIYSGASHCSEGSILGRVITPNRSLPLLLIMERIRVIVPKGHHSEGSLLHC